MNQEHDDLRAVGERLRKELSPATSPSRKAAQQAALLEALTLARPARPRFRLWQGAAVAASVLAGVVLASVVGGASKDHRLLATSVDRPYVVKALGAKQPTGDWLESHTGQLVVLFAGGSQARLQPRGTVKVLRSTIQRVAVRLVHGNLDMKVKGSGGCVWSVIAGSYRVTVVGTHFVVDWDIEKARLRVRVLSGRVRVEGPGLPASSVLLAQGQMLSVEQRTGRYVKERAVPGPVAGRSPTAPQSGTGSTSTVTGTSTSPSKSSGRRANGRPAKNGKRPVAGSKHATHPNGKPAARPPLKSWIELYRHGQYKAAVMAADHFGFETLCRSLSASDLWRLARAARITRKAQHAASALKAYRDRFPGTARARQAAYLLGRVYQELARSPAAASRWFRTYVQESPRGSHHEAALGKHMLTAKSAGSVQQAKRAARQYLKRYPYGTYSNQARALK